MKEWEMNISSEARNVIGWIFVTIPAIEFGGAFLLSELRRRNGVIKTPLQASYYRAGHAHAGVLVILAILAQLLIDVPELDAAIRGPLRAGFFLPPILISAGFFLGAPLKGEKPGVLINLVYLGALILVVSSLALGLTLVFGEGA
jgi:hypothetical protein